MFKRAIDDFSPAGGYPKQRIRSEGKTIIPPPSVYNMYYSVSRLPVYEGVYDEEKNKPMKNLNLECCCMGIPATKEKVNLGAINVNRKKQVLGIYKKYLAAKEDRIKREKIIESMKSKGMIIGPELKAALQRERERERMWKKLMA